MCPNNRSTPLIKKYHNTGVFLDLKKHLTVSHTESCCANYNCTGWVELLFNGSHPTKAKEGDRTFSHRLFSHRTPSHRQLHIRLVSHKDIFTHRQFHIQTFYHKASFTQVHLHTDIFTQ